MNVEEIMTQGVRTCRESDTLADAAQVMWESDCGCVPILSESGSGRLVGMVTDRDVCMSVHFRGSAPREVRIGDVMSCPVRTVGTTATLAEVEAVMHEAQVRRLPVVDRDGRVLGLVSLADLARRADGRAKKAGAVTEHEVCEALSAVCAPRPPAPLMAAHA